VSQLERIRVLIADDHRVFRGGLRTLLTQLQVAERAQAIVCAREAAMARQSAKL
jgi:DNA-binding NarL/FixJ family response regulator